MLITNKPKRRTFPKNLSSLGKKCVGHMLSKYHSKLLHCNFFLKSSRSRILCLSLSLDASEKKKVTCKYNIYKILTIEPD